MGILESIAEVNQPESVAKNNWLDSIEVNESSESVGAEANDKVEKVDVKPEEVVKPEVVKPVEVKEHQDRGAEKRIRELTRARKEADERFEMLQKQFDEFKKVKPTGPQVTKDSFNSEEEYLDWKLDQRDAARLEKQNESAKQVETSNKANEEFRNSWNARVNDNFKTPEEVERFSEITKEYSHEISKARPEIHTYVQHSKNGPLVLQMILENEEIYSELQKRPKDMVFQAMNNLEANILASRIPKKVSSAPAPVGKIDNKIDIVTSPDDLDEASWYDNYHKTKNRSRK